jgi:hypothetical protein
VTSLEFIRYPVTRVWYTENFNDSKKQWPNPNLAGRLDNINNELSASNKNIYIDEIQKLYEINLEGNVQLSAFNQTLSTFSRTLSADSI